jgi:hypothetical protein
MATYFTPIAVDAEAVAPTFNMPMQQLNDGIKSHNHNPGVTDSGGQLDHSWLSNHGVNTHGQIDAHIGSTANPHATNLTQVAALGGFVPATQVVRDVDEPATNDLLSANSTLQNNLNRIRYQLTQINGSAWNTTQRSIPVHTHSPSIVGDGGIVVQDGIAFDSSLSRARQVSANPSIRDNLNLIRQDVYDLQQGTGFGVGVITSTHIQNGGILSVDLADKAVTSDKLDTGAVGLNQLGPLLAVATSDATTKNLIIKILPGVFWPDGQTPVSVAQQTVVYSAAELPTTLRIDSISLNPSGAPVKTVGVPADVSPIPPTIPAGNMPVCQVFWHGVPTGTPVGIYQSANSVGYNSNSDGYIYKDTRPFLNFGGGSVRVTDEITSNSPANGSDTVFTLSGTFVVNSTHVTVATSNTATPITYQRVNTTPGVNQYREGSVTGTAPYNVITLGAAPAAGSYVRVSYDTAGSATGSGTALDYLGVMDITPSTTPNGSLTTFNLPDTFIVGSSHITVAASLTATPVIYTRVATTPGTNQYTEGSSTGTAPYNRVTFGVAPATGSVIRASYFKGDTLPVVNLIWDETPTGAINGTNLVYTTSYPFHSGSLQVYTTASANGTLTRYIKGTHYSESSALTGFTFTAGNAPKVGSVLVVSYARGDVATNNAQSVMGFTASSTPQAGKLLAINSDLKLPASITGDAASVGGFTPSQTPTGSQIPALNNGVLTLPSDVIVGNTKSLIFTKQAGDVNNSPAIKADATINNTRLILQSGNGGVVVRNNADTADIFSVTNTGSLVLSSTVVYPNNIGNTYSKNTLGNSSVIRHTPADYLKVTAGYSGLQIFNNADTTANVTITDAGNTTIRGTLGAQATAVASLNVAGATTLTGNTAVLGTLSVTGQLTAQLASGSSSGLQSTAHYNLLQGATVNNTASTLMLRDTAGSVSATYFNTSAPDNLQQQPYMFFGRTANDGFIRTFNPIALISGAALALQRGNADATKLDSINTTHPTESNGWAISYLPNGKRMGTRTIYGTFPAATDAIFGQFNTPYGLQLVNQVVITGTLVATNAGQINISLRGTGNTRGDGSNANIQIHASTLNSSTNLNAIAADGQFMMIAMEV